MTRRRWLAASVVVVGLVVVIVLSLKALLAWQRHEFDEFVERRRAAGEPTTFAELNPPPPADADNAAIEIDAALNAVYEQFGHEDTWPDVGPWGKTEVGSFEEQSPERVAAQREFVRRFEPFCDRVAAALERPRLRFRLVLDPLGLPDGHATRTLQAVTRIVASEAMTEDDPLRRIEAAHSLLLLGSRNEPLSAIDPMVNAAIAASAANAVRIGLARGEMDPAAARKRLDGLLQVDWSAIGARAFQAEIVSVTTMFAASLDSRIDEATWDRSMQVRWRGSQSRMVVAGCEMLDEASRLPVAPFAAYRRGAKSIRDRVETERNPIAIIVPKVVYTFALLEAKTRLARVALAAAEHRATHGDFPASLDELKPMFPDGVPLDPFTDAAFVYETTATGVRLASAGKFAEDGPRDEATIRELCPVWELKR